MPYIRQWFYVYMFVFSINSVQDPDSEAREYHYLIASTRLLVNIDFEHVHTLLHTQTYTRITIITIITYKHTHKHTDM